MPCTHKTVRRDHRAVAALAGQRRSLDRINDAHDVCVTVGTTTLVSDGDTVGTSVTVGDSDTVGTSTEVVTCLGSNFAVMC